MKVKYKSRALISFEGKCPMKCKHCYTYELDSYAEDYDIFSIANKVAPKDCDIMYVSQRYENFYDEDYGYSLCIELYTRYHKDIFIITRSNLSDRMIKKLNDLNDQMREHGNSLYLAVSVCANESYGVTEDSSICPTPIERLSVLQRAHILGIKTVLLLRPIFPNELIPVKECESLISLFSQYIDAVVTSGLIVTEGIIKRLQIDRESLDFFKCGDSTYLADLKEKEVLYLDVEDELCAIECQCFEEGLPCFRHTLPALNYLSEK